MHSTNRTILVEMKHRLKKDEMLVPECACIGQETISRCACFPQLLCLFPTCYLPRKGNILGVDSNSRTPNRISLKSVIASSGNHKAGCELP